MSASRMRHTIFPTRWGYFGLLCQAESVCRTCLPVSRQAVARQSLLAGTRFEPDDVPFERGLLADLQTRICAYFDGENVDFSTLPAVFLAEQSDFGQAILAACRRIGFGQTRTYGQLAESAGRPRAARAVGGVMARNPVPLIVPCHRVVRTNGGLGGFSAFGGTAMKQRMLRHEQTPDGHVCWQGSAHAVQRK